MSKATPAKSIKGLQPMKKLLTGNVIIKLIQRASTNEHNT